MDYNTIKTLAADNGIPMSNGEWWYTLDGKTPAERRRSLKGAATAYEQRFNVLLPGAHRRMFRIGKTIYMSYDKPEIERARLDNEEPVQLLLGMTP